MTAEEFAEKYDGFKMSLGVRVGYRYVVEGRWVDSELPDDRRFMEFDIPAEIAETLEAVARSQTQASNRETCAAHRRALDTLVRHHDNPHVRYLKAMLDLRLGAGDSEEHRREQARALHEIFDGRAATVLGLPGASEENVTFVGEAGR